MRLLLFIVSLTLVVQPAYSASSPTFVDVTDTAGLDYFGKLADQGEVLDPAAHDNEGVYVADYNNDHWPDVLTVGDEHPVLFTNKGGTFSRDETFPEIQEKIMGALWVDYNQDGWPDLVLVPIHGQPLLLHNNEGTLSVKRQIASPILDFGFGATSGDFNSDGCPDLFILQYADIDEQNTSKMSHFRRGGSHKDLSHDNANRNHLLLGDCDSHSFKHVPSKTFHRKHWSLAASAVDANGNGLQDIHVANDYYLDSLYINQGNGAFEHRYLGQFTNRNGMASELLDFNHDGQTDIFVSNIFVEPSSTVIHPGRFRTLITSDPDGHNMLVNRRNNHSDTIFTDEAQTLGVQKGGWGWSAAWADFDLDIDRELLLARSNLLEEQIGINFFRIKRFPVAKTIGELKGNHLPKDSIVESDLYDHLSEWLGYPAYWEKTKNKFEKENYSTTGFPRLDARGVSRIDYDRDGKLDVIFSQRDDEFKLFRNETLGNDDKNWIKLDVKNAFLGGQIHLTIGNTTINIPFSAHTDFLSQESPYYHSGLGNHDVVNRITITWNTGEETSRTNVKGNRLYKATPDSFSIIPRQ